jgi:hypothetical protein
MIVQMVPPSSVPAPPPPPCDLGLVFVSPPVRYERDPRTGRPLSDFRLTEAGRRALAEADGK